MKTIKIINALSIGVCLLFATTLFVACEKDDTDDHEMTYTLSGSASGSQEVPSVTTTATGTLTGSYNAVSNTLTYNITWTGLSGTVAAIHFHGPALAGEEANPVHTLVISTNGAAGTSSGSVVLDATTEGYLIAGKLYYNLHTALNPDGEIRGQVTATPN